MKRCAFIAVLLPLLVSAGCGNKNLVLTIDLLSYVEPEYKSTDYGPIPPNIPTTEVDLVQTEINLLQAIGDATQVKSATLHVSADFDNATGSASGDFQIHISKVEIASQYEGTLAADLPVALLPSHITTVDQVIPVSPEQLDALTSETAWFAVRVACSTEGSNDNLQGTAVLTKLTAVLVTENNL